MSAAGSGRTECARLLLEAGAHKEAKDKVLAGCIIIENVLFCFASCHYSSAPASLSVMFRDS
jgi:hypothetical protein